MSRFRVSVDIGGTFTDFVIHDQEAGRAFTGKVLSTPRNPAEGVITGLTQLIADPRQIEFIVHGTTVGLNAFLERRGTRVLLITTDGFKDVYTIARGDRKKLYDLHYAKPKPLVPPATSTLSASGCGGMATVQTPLRPEDFDPIVEKIEAEGIDAVAVCFLHANVNPIHELEARRIIQERLPEVSVSLSHEVAREWREYERTSSVVLNAYIAPVTQGYLEESGGADCRARRPGPPPRHAVERRRDDLGRGAPDPDPDAPLRPGRRHHRRAGVERGARPAEPALRRHGRDLVRRQPDRRRKPLGLDRDGARRVARPDVDRRHPHHRRRRRLARLAGGRRLAGRPPQRGSGARPRLLRPGRHPADRHRRQPPPRPAQPRLLPRRRDDARPCRRAASDPDRSPSSSVSTTRRSREGILAIVNAKMADAMRTITIRRGIDPRDYSLVAYGGAGPMHAVALAEELDISEVIVPWAPGTFSAWGMLQSDIRHDLARTFYAPLADTTPGAIEAIFADLEEQGRQVLRAEEVPDERMRFVCTADMRYVGQEYFVNLVVPHEEPITDRSVASMIERFHAAYHIRYGHSTPGAPLELVNLRVVAIGSLPGRIEGFQPAASERRWSRGAVESSLTASPTTRRSSQRGTLPLGFAFRGPAIVEEETATTAVPPGWQGRVDELGNLILTPVSG